MAVDRLHPRVDAVTFVVVAALQGTITILAVYLRAPRAVRVDPTIALRYANTLLDLFQSITQYSSHRELTKTILHAPGLVGNKGTHAAANHFVVVNY